MNHWWLDRTGRIEWLNQDFFPRTVSVDLLGKTFCQSKKDLRCDENGAIYDLKKRLNLCFLRNNAHTYLI